MQQNSQDFNAFWKTLFSFTTTKVASFVVCWKWWRKGEKKSASLKFNGSEENEFFDGERSASSVVISRLSSWIMMIYGRRTRFDRFNCLFRIRRHSHPSRKLPSSQRCKIQVTSSIDKSFDLFSSWKYFQTFPHSDGKTRKTTFRSITRRSCVAENVFNARKKNKFPRIAKAFPRWERKLFHRVGFQWIKII